MFNRQGEKMKNCIIFKNDGEIDYRAFTNFGISSKPNSSNAIGYFGTGLKYAVAVLLREGCGITVYSGENKLTFEKIAGNFRGQEFDFIQLTINESSPIELAFTTELGKNWELWCAYRELACNCMDEGGDAELSGDFPVSGIAGSTLIIVTGDRFVEEHERRDTLLLSHAPDIHTSKMNLHLRQTTHVFYKGVRVGNVSPCLYTYDALTGMSLTEDRTLSSTYEFRNTLARVIVSEVSDKSVIENIVLCDINWWEHDMDFDWSSASPSDEFLSVIGKLVERKVSKINPSALVVWKKATQGEVEPSPITLTKVQQNMYEKAVGFCEKFGFDILDYPVKFVGELGSGTLAMAHEGTIFITERVFHQGTKQLASTLIEEYLHLHHGYDDCSRELQTYLFDRVVSMGEEINGEVL
jgi:hypothetical protein